jgi:hypothetical protein
MSKVDIDLQKQILERINMIEKPTVSVSLNTNLLKEIKKNEIYANLKAVWCTDGKTNKDKKEIINSQIADLKDCYSSQKLLTSKGNKRSPKGF